MRRSDWGLTNRGMRLLVYSDTGPGRLPAVPAGPRRPRHPFRCKKTFRLLWPLPVPWTQTREWQLYRWLSTSMRRECCSVPGVGLFTSLRPDRIPNGPSSHAREVHPAWNRIVGQTGVMPGPAKGMRWNLTQALDLKAILESSDSCPRDIWRAWTWLNISAWI